MSESIGQLAASLAPGESTTRRVRGQTWKYTKVAEPAACGTCCGAREVPRMVGNGSTPCPSCCCEICGSVTDTPPECRDCATGEES